MALLVWLPLNGNLNNLGTLNNSVINSGATTNSSGKIGSCYLFDGTNDYIETTYVSDSTDITFCLWAYFSSSLRGCHLLDCRNSSGVGYLPLYIGNGSILIGNSNVSFPSVTYTFSDNVWYHICVTHDSSYGKIYINGNLIATTTCNGSNFNTSLPIRVGARYSSENWFNGKVNDVRVYNECLSDKLIKEIAKGLVLHLPMNQPNRNENIILTGNKVTGGGNASGITSSYEADGSMKIVSTSGNGNWRSVSFAQDSNSNVGAKMSVGDTYTISVDIKVEVGTVLPTLFINSGNGYKLLQGTIKLGLWIRAYYTSTWAEPGTSYGNISLHLGFSSAVGTYYFKNFKLEKSSFVTPFSLAPTDPISSGTLEFDCSGLQYDCTVSGTIGLSNSSPRNNLSYVFNGATKLYRTFNVPEIKTLSLWVYVSSIPSDSRIIYQDEISQTGFGFYSGAYFIASATKSRPKYDIPSNFVANQWNHVVVIYDDSNPACYVNGVATTANGTELWSSPSGLTIGSRAINNCYFNGKLSDLRLYTTILSIDDIKLLYNSPIEVTNNGSLITLGEVIEV